MQIALAGCCCGGQSQTACFFQSLLPPKVSYEWGQFRSADFPEGKVSLIFGSE